MHENPFLNRLGRVSSLTSGEGGGPAAGQMVSLAPLQGKISGPWEASQPLQSVQGPSFQQAITQSLQSINNTARAPDRLLQEAITTGRVDIHEVMIANTKAELAINMTSTVVTKAIQAYDRILQIQV
jgi:flagellar hook-basal body complex protein FliE